MKENKRQLFLFVLFCVLVSVVLFAGPALTGRGAAQFLAGHTHVFQPATMIEVLVVVALAGMLVLRKLGRPAADKATGELGLASVPADGRREKLAEEEDFDKFVVELRAGPVAAPGAAVSPLPEVRAGRTGGKLEAETESRLDQG